MDRGNPLTYFDEITFRDRFRIYRAEKITERISAQEGWSSVCLDYESFSVFTQHSSFQAKKMPQGDHCYSSTAQLPEATLLEDHEEADLPVAEADNDLQGLARRNTFTMQHFS